MASQLKITAVEPRYAVPGGEITVICEGFDAGHDAGGGVFVGGEPCRIVSAAARRIVANIPDEAAGGDSVVHIECRGATSGPMPLSVGRLLAADMHIVANPAVDPSDDALILTRSGSRGQHLPATLFRLEPDGYVDELPEPILNPTGVAFGPDGQMYVTNRAQGEVYAVGRDGTATVYATGLGIATGIAFDAEGLMYVGDRSGTIFRVRELGEVETFTVMEPSVAAYHMAFGPDGRLFVTSPGLASHDAVHVIDKEGFDEAFFRGFGRPQGLAFDKAGNLYVAACYMGSHGIVKILPEGSTAEYFVAGNNVVGLCFTRKGEMIVATGDSVYAIDCGIEGTLL
jgi:sugar lactone lactonase YvrE